MKTTYLSIAIAVAGLTVLAIAPPAFAGSEADDYRHDAEDSATRSTRDFLDLAECGGSDCPDKFDRARTILDELDNESDLRRKADDLDDSSSGDSSDDDSGD